MKRSVALVVAALLYGRGVHADVIKVEGGGASISSEFLAVHTIFESETGHSMSVVQSSAVAGLIALNAGKVDVAAAAHPLEDLLAAAAAAGVIIDKSTLVAIPIGENRLIAILHRSNPVKKLSKEQLKSIFTGKIGNWKDLGGTDLDLVAVWGTETEGQNMQFTRMVLDGEPVTANVRHVKGYRSIVNLVSVLPSGIGIIPVGMSSGLTHTPEIPAIPSPIFLITKGPPSPAVQQFIDIYAREMSFLK